MIYIGLDAHKKFCWASMMDGSGNKIDQKKFPTREDDLNAFVNEVGSNTRVVVEASTTGLYVYALAPEEWML